MICPELNVRIKIQIGIYIKEANGELLHYSKIKKTCRRLAGRFQ